MKDGGYSDDFSKSNRAVYAESQGLFPASKIAKRLGHGCTVAGIREVLEPTEWHHTSKMYNTTDYFDFREAQEHFEEIKKASIKKENSKTLNNAKVEWLEWYGTRNHPHSMNKTEDDCTVEYAGGSFCIITLPSGVKIRKKVTTNGFFINGHLPEIELEI